MIFFAPKCTLPPGESSGFVSSPDTRSTMDIVWSCISIILLSTWSILHLDLPAHLTAKAGKEGLCKTVYLLWRKTFWMGLKLFSPEFAATGCARKIFATRSNSTRLQQLAHRDGVPWSLTHTIFVDMGGIALRFEKDETKKGNESNGPASTQRNGPAPTKNADRFIDEFCESQSRILGHCGKIPWSKLEAHVAHALKKKEDVEKDGRLDFATMRKNVAALAGDIWILDSCQLAIAREMEIIDKMPRLEEDDITDRSKADSLVKGLAMLQILWLVVQLIVRRIHKLPFTQLEISTVAFAASAIIIYSIDFVKPKDVNVPFYFDVPKKKTKETKETKEETVTYEQFSAIVDAAPFAYVQGKRYYMPTSTLHDLIEYKVEDEVKIEGKACDKESRCWCNRCGQCRWSAFDGSGTLRRALCCSKCRKLIMSKDMANDLSLLIGFVSATSFGGVHLFAWNGHFPTDVERLLWKIAALMTIGLPYVYICSHLLFLRSDIKTINKTTRWEMKSVMLVIASFYVPCRLFLIAESFRALYYMEPMAFRSTWASNIPHVG